MTIIGLKTKTGQVNVSARGSIVVSRRIKTPRWLLADDLLPYYLTLLSSVTLINTSSYAVKLWPSVCVRWGCLSDGCLQNTSMDGGLCNGGSRGVVVNGAETYFLLTFIMNWQPELICVSKCVHTYQDALFCLHGWSQTVIILLDGLHDKKCHDKGRRREFTCEKQTTQQSGRPRAVICRVCWGVKGGTKHLQN